MSSRCRIIFYWLFSSFHFIYDFVFIMFSEWQLLIDCLIHTPHISQWYSISLLFVANPPQFSPGVRASESSKIKLSIRPNKWFDSDESRALNKNDFLLVYSSTCFAPYRKTFSYCFLVQRRFLFLFCFALFSYVSQNFKHGIALILLISSRTLNTTSPLFMITPNHVESVRA